MGAQAEASGPDLRAGIGLDEIAAKGTIGGRVGDSPVLLSRLDGELFALSGACTHYGGALADGLVSGGSVRCPLHHACFDLRTGAALRTPALDPLQQWRVDVEGGKVFVREKLEVQEPSEASSADAGHVVIVGAGAAGLACAHELRRLGHAGAITMLAADDEPPCDRPNLSKDYLAGTAPEEWLPLRQEQWYAENRVALRLDAPVERIDAAAREVHAAGETIPYDRLLLATGSEPNTLKVPGTDEGHVFTLRSIADARAIAARAERGSRAVVVGSSFIGMEAAAALRQRGVAVTVVSPEQVPFERVFGAEIGAWLQRLHERNGVRFHLGTVPSALEGDTVRLADGSSLEADFVLVGIGVRPRIELARAADIPGDRGVPVDCYLETCRPGIFAAGDIAEYPDPLSGEPVRIEHWVTAQRQGQVAAANMLGQGRRFEAVPFFWTEQHGVPLRYVGHASRWDEVRIDGDIESGAFIARYYDQGEHRASAGVGRDRDILEDEAQFERRIAKGREPPPPSGIQSATASVEAQRGS